MEACNRASTRNQDALAHPAVVAVHNPLECNLAGAKTLHWVEEGIDWYLDNSFLVDKRVLQCWAEVDLRPDTPAVVNMALHNL